MAIIRRQLSGNIPLYFWIEGRRSRVQKNGETIGPNSIVYIGGPEEDICQFIDEDEVSKLFQDFVPVLDEPWDPGKDYERWGWIKVADYLKEVVQ